MVRQQRYISCRAEIDDYRSGAQHMCICNVERRNHSVLG